MNCYYHPELESTNACVVCRHPLCPSCSHSVKGRIYCQDCLVEGARLAGIARRPEVANYSPSRAAFFGIIPGIGAVYNRQYTKAVIHFAIFAALSILAGEGHPVFGFAVVAFWIFTVIDAYRSAEAIMSKRIHDPGYGASEPDEEMRLPVWGLALVLLGLLFFLSNLQVVSLSGIVEFGWPLLFMAAGVYLILQYFFYKSEGPVAAATRVESPLTDLSEAPAPTPPPPIGDEELTRSDTSQKGVGE